MNQDTRVLIAFALSFVMLVLWRVVVVKEQPPKPKPAPAEQSQGAGPEQKPGQAQPAAPQPAAASAKAAQPAKPPPRVSLPVEKGTEAREIIVESELYRVTLSTQGAVVKSWVLKKYHDELGKPLNVVNTPACEKLGYPMTISLPEASDPALADQINQAVFVVKPSETDVQAPAKVEFTYSDGKVRVRKEFTFGEKYEVKAEVSVFDGQHDLPLAVEWPGGFGDQSLDYSDREAYGQAVYSAS